MQFPSPSRLIGLIAPVIALAAACSDAEVGGGGQPLVGALGGAGSTQCPVGWLQCLAGCVNPNDDSAHCGGCEQACVLGTSCQSGTCTATQPGEAGAGSTLPLPMTAAGASGIGAGGSTATGGPSGGGAAPSAGAGLGGAGGLGLAGTAGTPSSAGTGGSLPSTPNGDGYFVVENLDRGLVAVPAQQGNYVGWRMLGYEYVEDPARVSYNVYRDGELLANVGDSTNYEDASGTSGSSYAVAAVVDGVEQPLSETATPWADRYLRIPLDPPGPNTPNDASAADLDGDGEYEIILKWEANNAKDNSQAGVTDDVFLDALKLDGTLMWRINLGPNIRAGAHYTQFIVMDFDGDGRAEMAVKTAPGTRDATGEYLSLGPAANDDDSADYRNGEGYVLSGPEYLTVFDGLTGTELATESFRIPRGNVDAWGDGYGNRVDRFLATAAYVDDSGLPSIVMARGYYTRTTLTAWNWRDGQLSEHWTFDSDESGSQWTGQGCHSLSVANVDADPQQEIVYGAMIVDHDGTALCRTGYGHGDALHASDFLPDRPGIEVFMPQENGGVPLWTLYDAATCDVIHAGAVSDTDVGRGVAADVTASSPGAEMWASSGVPLTSMSSGSNVGSAPSSINFLVWWDADELRETEDGTTVSKYGGGALLTCTECSSNNGTKSTPALVADLLGDWREEVIWREANDSALRIYTTSDVTQRRIYTLMHDLQYRVAISWQNVAYNQPPHPGFFLGADMPPPPIPDITTP